MQRCLIRIVCLEFCETNISNTISKTSRERYIISYLLVAIQRARARLTDKLLWNNTDRVTLQPRVWFCIQWLTTLMSVNVNSSAHLSDVDIRRERRECILAINQSGNYKSRNRTKQNDFMTVWDEERVSRVDRTIEVTSRIVYD